MMSSYANNALKNVNKKTKSNTNKTMKTKSSNIPKLINLYKFKLSMNQIFDVSTPNLQKKYIYLGINQFKNDYLRKI